eukprot:13717-Hanusia_phi.AAC.1
MRTRTARQEWTVRKLQMTTTTKRNRRRCRQVGDYGRGEEGRKGEQEGERSARRRGARTTMEERIGGMELSSARIMRRRRRARRTRRSVRRT